MYVHTLFYIMDLRIFCKKRGLLNHANITTNGNHKQTNILQIVRCNKSVIKTVISLFRCPYQINNESLPRPCPGKRLVVDRSKAITAIYLLQKNLKRFLPCEVQTSLYDHYIPNNICVKHERLSLFYTTTNELCLMICQYII